MALTGVLVVAACGGGGGDDNTADRMIINTGPDAGEQPGEPDAGDEPATCEAPAAYGDLGALAGAAAAQIPQDEAQPAGPKLIALQADLNENPNPDIVIVELWDGYGAYEGGAVATGSVTISGVETDYSTCGACVLVLTDVVPGSSPLQFSSAYVASGGTLDLTSVTGNLTGSLANVTLRHVNLPTQQAPQSDHPDGCTTSISATFDTAIQMP